MLTNCVIMIVNQFYEKWAVAKTIKEDHQTSLGISSIRNIVSVPPILIMLFSEMVYRGKVLSLPGLVHSQGSMVAIFLSGLTTPFLSLSTVVLFKLMRNTSIAVAGGFNKFLTVIFASYMFQAGLVLAQWIGIGTCIAGSILYAFV